MLAQFPSGWDDHEVECVSLERAPQIPSEQSAAEGILR